MRQCLALARQAYDEEEVPIGAVVISGQGRLLGKGYNQVERLNDVTAHAEMLAITAAAHTLGGKYLEGCTLYVTLEPCAMCAGALRWAQLARVVYGAPEPKHGFTQWGTGLLHPRTQVVGGVLQAECAALMQAFFRARRT